MSELKDQLSKVKEELSELTKNRKKIMSEREDLKKRDKELSENIGRIDSEIFHLCEEHGLLDRDSIDPDDRVQYSEGLRISYGSVTKAYLSNDPASLRSFIEWVGSVDTAHPGIGMDDIYTLKLKPKGLEALEQKGGKIPDYIHMESGSLYPKITKDTRKGVN